MFSRFSEALPGMMHIRLIKSFHEFAISSAANYTQTQWQCLVCQGYHFLAYPDSPEKYRVKTQYIDTELSPKAFGAYISLMVFNHWATQMVEIEDTRLSQFFRYHFHDSKRYLIDSCHQLGIEQFEAKLVARLID
ncbi:hypothetical protein [Shewanella sp. UCD-KL12]|uniref:hypothetical protein n=1 Tax=Shewanella sp. UCD-KL12 TaxID=1917163 RepID=UPI0009708289|nr:hypothetical protein [Shewanella sp. UCD-KL12]